DRGCRAAGDREALRAGAVECRALAGAGAEVADAVQVEVAVGSRSSPCIVEEVDRERVCACAEVALEGEALAGAGSVRCGGGEVAAELLAVDRDGELRVALVGILRYLEHQRVGAAADCRAGDGGAVGHAEAFAAGAHQRGTLAGRLAVVADGVDVEVAV